MSQAKTSLVNQTLGLIRAENQIDDIDTDTSANAKAAKLFLDDHIRELMSEYDWNWCSRTKNLADITDDQAPPADWLYRYTWPQDCLVPRMILATGYVRNQTPIAFRVETLPDGSARSILTDQNSAQLRYTSKNYEELVENWPDYFRRAVSFRLAASLATAIKESATLAAQMMEMYVDAMRMARYIDESGGFRGDNQDPAAIRKRRGGSSTARRRENDGTYYQEYLGKV
jgi:hypothetical protein